MTTKIYFCEIIQGLIPDYLSSKLADNETREITRHISQCRECRDHLHEKMAHNIWTAQQAALARAFTEPVPRLGNSRLWVPLPPLRLANEHRDVKERIGAMYRFWKPTQKPATTSPTRGAYMSGNAAHSAPPEAKILSIVLPETVGEQVGEDAQAMVTDGPLISADGEFRFRVVGKRLDWPGQRLICVLRLVEDDAIRFEAEIVEDAQGKGWQASFAATELPPPADGEKRIPIDSRFLQLYLLSPAPDMS